MARDVVIRMSMQPLRYQFHGTLADGFAFADELVVHAEIKAQLQEKLKAAVVEFGRAGMAINTKKAKPTPWNEEKREDLGLAYHKH
ncbi:hypothetical protein T265_02460 [Opisthorchis viverrini]|uniref:Reverse transcriptase domain-containing protein n=1 Tax=Opisthorchis viverrini TaxID=6198 RepID=A0A074ZVZ1_OPIVI|nr:hypothetical protein T265_02460 [Opisthorchis viverrini]KER31276.1 hypothetical protein T265_02460 [Opisthorchis viverrini]